MFIETVQELKHRRILKNLSGHSGCKIFLVETEDGVLVSKISGGENYNFRLKRQCKKQSKFVSQGEVGAPKIINYGYEQNCFFFDMEFVRGKTMAEYSENIKISEITDYIRCLFRSLYWKNNEENLLANKIFLNKISSLERSLEAFNNLEKVFELLKAFNWSKVYKSPCHGDLTLENIIVSENKKLYLIDFLDSFYNSWMVDVAKLLQDLELKWSFRHEELSQNHLLRLQVAKEALIEEILSTDAGDEKLNTIYHLLLLNVVRIYPYAHDEVTFKYLDNAVEFLMNKFKEEKKECF